VTGVLVTGAAGGSMTIGPLPDPGAAQAAIAKYDKLGPSVTTSMALSGYPVGPVSEARIQRVAAAMLEFGLLGRQYAAGVEQGTLIKSMVGPAS
jgi:hypothetical protein